MSLPRRTAGVGRTSIACQCISLRPGIRVRPPPSMMRVSALRSTAIGSREMRSMILPRINTLDGADSAGDLPSKMRTLLNSVTGPEASCAWDESGDSPQDSANQNKILLPSIANSIDGLSIDVRIQASDPSAAQLRPGQPQFKAKARNLMALGRN